MPIVRIDGCEVYHAISGPADAPAVLLLHGLGSSGDDWMHQTPVLAERYRVLTVDLPGHHRSAPLRGRLTVARTASTVCGVLDALGIERAHVVGLSLGGCVAIELALEDPGRVRSLVLVNTFARLRPTGARAALRGAARLGLALAAPMSVLARHVAREAFPGPEQVALRLAATERLARNSRRQYVRSLAAVLRFDARKRLSRITCPTLVVAGACDATVPFAPKQLLSRSIAGARMRVVEASGHVTPYDRPEAFNRLLVAHLEELDLSLPRTVDKAAALHTLSMSTLPNRKEGEFTMLRLGDTAPDFTADTTNGKIQFHQWLGDKWGILFSHPRDFTPVCTTELGYVAKLKPEFDKRNVKPIGLSVDPVDSHNRWASDINETQGSVVNFPIIADPERKVANLFGMMHPAHDEVYTVRTVFVIDPAKKIRLMITYPQTCGRNFDEILRVIDSLQLTDRHKVATPVNWKAGEDVIIVPAVTDDEAKQKFPGFKTHKPYLRTTAQPK